MEEARCWRLTKTSFYQEAEYPWPPRSYSCSFCRREFRSAQALGGHVNVHRRDRARMKLSSSTQLSRIPGAVSAPVAPPFRVSAVSMGEKGKDQILVAESPGCKRRRCGWSNPLALRFTDNDENLLPAEVITAAAVSVEEIDLELRLGGSARG